MSPLTGKTAVVTGAGRGIGRAIAQRLAADGARVGVHYGTRADTAEQTVHQIREAAGSAFPPVFVVQQGLTRLHDGGRIVNLSTRFTHGMRIPELLTYAMSKAAIDAFTATLAKQLAPQGITVNAVGPGSVDTDMNAGRLATPEGRAAVAAQSPFNRVAQPAEIADIVAILASDDARWVTGQWIDATGGSML
ncbi:MULTISPECIES: SDR family oxidoreductase [unclassified Mycolicibacterium]|uniref:SDR family oxidoreductase n=1 Tax=unclassified Mycolicibacterium TaxID=2636767 RepID=UPI002ED7B1AE